MSARGSNLERALSGFLAYYLAQIRDRRVVGLHPRLGRAQHLAAAKMVDQRQQRRRRQNIDPAGPGRLAAGRFGADYAAPAAHNAAANTPDTGLIPPSSDSSPSVT